VQAGQTAEAGGYFEKAQDLMSSCRKKDPNNQRLNRESASLASFAN